MERAIGRLPNEGNLCYANVILQCLAHGPFDLQVLSPSAAAPASGASGSILLQLWSVLESVRACQDDSSARPLIEVLSSANKSFSSDDQQDADEFFKVLMDTVLEHLKKSNTSAYEKLRQLIYGRIVQEVACGCGQTSRRFEDFLSLDLHIEMPSAQGSEPLSDLLRHARLSTAPQPSRPEPTLQRCLLQQFKTEQVEGYHCDRCGSKSAVAKVRRRLDAIPSLLVIHLSRFCVNPYTGRQEKNSSYVRFEERLSLAIFAADRSAAKHLNFRLRSVVMHLGSIRGGHYVCYVCSAKDNNWYGVSDTIHRRVELSEVLDAEAFMLFYVRDDGAT